MDDTLSLAALLFALAAPGLFAALAGRRLSTTGEPNEINRRWVAYGRQKLFVLLVCVVSAAMIEPSSASVLGATFGMLAGGFPTRRRLFNESWGFTEYVGHILTTPLALAGPELVVAFAPTAFSALGPAATVVLALAAAAWGLQRGRMAAALSHSAPLEDQGLIAHFHELESRAGVPMKAWRVYGPESGGTLNLMSFGRTGLVTRRALRELTPTQLQAGDALLLASAATNRWYIFARHTLLLACCALLVISALAGWFAAPWPFFLPLVVYAFFLFTALRATANAPLTDRRAVELHGDAQAVAAALTRVAVTQFPRPDAGEAALALAPAIQRRVRAMAAHGAQQSSTATPTGLAEPVIIEASVPERTIVILDHSRVLRFDGTPPDCPRLMADLQARASSMRACVYTELKQLHLSGNKLQVTELDGAAWSIGVRDADIARVQRALGVVGERLQDNPHRTHTLARVLAAGAFLAILAADSPSLTVLLCSVLTLSLPGRASLLVLAAVTSGSAVTALGHTGAFEVACLLSLGIFAGALALHAPRGGPRRERAVVGIIAAFGGLAALRLGLVVPDWLLVHRIAHAGGVMNASLLAGLAAALMLALPRRRAVPSAGAVLLGCVWLGVGSMAFAARMVDDPLFSSHEPLRAEEHTPATLQREIPLGSSHARTVAVSPSCASVAFADDVRESKWRILPAVGAERVVSAAALAYLDEDRVLVAGEADQAWALRTVNPASGLSTGAVEIPQLTDPLLLVSSRSSAWTLCGGVSQARRWCARGNAGERPALTRSVAATAGASDTFMLPDGAVFHAGHDFRRATRSGMWNLRQILAMTSGQTLFPAELSLTDDAGTRTLLVSNAGFVSCSLDNVDESGVTCMSRGETNVLGRLDVKTGTFEPVATFKERTSPYKRLSDGRLLMGDDDDAVLLFDPANGHLTVLPVAGGNILAAGDNCFVVSDWRQRANLLRVYQIPAR